MIHDVLQHYYENWCSPESWSSLLTSLLAENHRGACALRQAVKKFLLKDVKLVKRLVVFSHVPTLKHGYVTHKRLFPLIHKPSSFF